MYSFDHCINLDSLLSSSYYSAWQFRVYDGWMICHTQYINATSIKDTLPQKYLHEHKSLRIQKILHCYRVVLCLFSYMFLCLHVNAQSLFRNKEIKTRISHEKYRI